MYEASRPKAYENTALKALRWMAKFGAGISGA